MPLLTHVSSSASPLSNVQAHSSIAGDGDGDGEGDGDGDGDDSALGVSGGSRGGGSGGKGGGFGGGEYSQYRHVAPSASPAWADTMQTGPST